MTRRRAGGLGVGGERLFPPSNGLTSLWMIFNRMYVTIINSVAVNRLLLANALLQPNPGKMALKLMSVLFTLKELTNCNVTGRTSSTNPNRMATIKPLNSKMVAYIRGKVEKNWPGSYTLELVKKLNQKCTDTYNHNPDLRVKP